MKGYRALVMVDLLMQECRMAIMNEDYEKCYNALEKLQACLPSKLSTKRQSSTGVS